MGILSTTHAREDITRLCLPCQYGFCVDLVLNSWVTNNIIKVTFSGLNVYLVYGAISNGLA